MTLKSSITTASGKAGNRLPLVRPAHGWNYQYVTTSPGEMLAEEFLKQCFRYDQIWFSQKLHTAAVEIVP